MFNFSVLEQLIGFSQDAFQHLSPAMTQLVRSTSVELQKLKQSYQNNDAKAIEYFMHKLRGSYATLGATTLPELSRPMEQALHQSGQLPGAEAFAEYLECVEQTSAALELWLTQFEHHSDTTTPDVLQYIQYLENSDMQAYSLFQQQRSGWIAYLGAEDFVLMEQEIMTLNFVAATERLKRIMQHKEAGQ